MDEYLYEVMARTAWESINPDGMPWNALPLEELRNRMRGAARDILVDLGVNDMITPDVFKHEWEMRDK